MSHSDSTSTNASTSAHSGGLRSVSKSEPCPHCGKPDWCYFLGDNLSACKRSAPPAFGWVATGIADKEGTPYYVQGDSAANKTVRPKNSRTWEYPDRTGNRRVRVCRLSVPLRAEEGLLRHQLKWRGCLPQAVRGSPENIFCF